jgi:alkylated DNA repair protein (DNA oxidative demethylase)
MIDDLFAEAPRLDTEWLAPGAALLHGFALADEANILAAVHHIIDKAPFRHMMTSRGFRMSVAITNAGSLGWISDRSGYRYIAVDPESGLTWPPLPSSLTTLAQSAAALAGYPDFQPDACLINRYVPGARMSLHQDRHLA